LKGLAPDFTEIARYFSSVSMAMSMPSLGDMNPPETAFAIGSKKASPNVPSSEEVMNALNIPSTISVAL